MTDVGHAHTFAATDFHFIDITDAQEPLKAVIISSLPTSGTLKLMLPGTNGVAVTANTTIQAADIGYLVYTPNSGQGTDGFQFRVQDSGGTAGGGSDTSATPATMTITIKTNDAPVAVAS